MMPPDSPPSRDRRPIVLGLVVLLSLVLPVLIVMGSVSAAFSNWPLGLVMAEQHHYASGTIKNGELWYPATKYARATYSPPCESRIVRLDLQTGDHRETGLTLPAGTGNRVYEEFDLIWDHEQLYVADSWASLRTVWKVADSGLEWMTTLPPRNPALFFVHAPFFDHGRFTVVEQISDGEYRLTHLSNGSWAKGRRIRLPTVNARWVNETGRPRIRDDAGLPPNRHRYYLTMIPEGEDLHVRYVILDVNNQPLFAAYRKGFEFLEETEPDSAESPANHELDPAGWEQINSSGNSAVWWGEFSPEQESLLFGVRENGQNRFVRRQANGQWTVLSELEPTSQDRDFDTLIRDQSGPCYICRGSLGWWNRAAFYPIAGDQILPAQLTLSGDEQRYMNRWGRFGGGILLAWISHVVVLISGQQFCHSASSPSELDRPRAVLALPWPRAFAFLIDLVVLLVLIAISFSIHWHYSGLEWQRNADSKLSQVLLHAEMQIDPPFVGHVYASALNIVDCIFNPEDFIGCPKDSKQFLNLLLLVVLDTLLPLCFFRAYTEGRTGATPGKWLTGIRTVRSTLCPCGWARAVVRSAMYFVDLPFWITPLPATISMILSPSRQRLGDRVADTLVIHSK